MGLNLGICGVGSLGSLFAAKIADMKSRSPVQIYMLGNWDEQIRQINYQGLRLISSGNVEKTTRLTALHWEDCPPLDLAMVLNKSYQTKATAKHLVGRMSKGGLVLTLQNGLGNSDILRQHTDAMVLSGVTSEAAHRPRPGNVVHAGRGRTIIESASHPLTAVLLNILRSAGFETDTTCRIEEAVWKKLLVNIAINPLTAIFGIRNGELTADAALFTLACDAASEAAAVAAAKGISTPEVESLIRAVCGKTADNLSSMLQDVAAGRETEIDALSGAVIRLGEKTGIATPVNALLMEGVKDITGASDGQREIVRHNIRNFVHRETV